MGLADGRVISEQSACGVNGVPLKWAECLWSGQSACEVGRVSAFYTHQYTNGVFSYCYSIHKYCLRMTRLKGMNSVLHSKLIETLGYSESIYATFEYSPYKLLQLLSWSHFRSCT